MNKEMKLLARKLTALFLSLTLVIGLAPGKIQAEQTQEFSYEILDCEDTYYSGFNDHVAVATGTFIELSYGDDAVPNYIFVDEAVAKEEGASYTQEITINYSDMAEAEIAYEEGDVYLKVNLEGEEILREKLYTPKTVSFSEMPVISLNEEVAVANGVGKYCEQYYRIDASSLSASNKYKVFTLALEDESDEDYDEDYEEDYENDYDLGYDDTYIYLYDEEGLLIDENDDSDGEEDGVDSSLIFAMPENGERIVGVRGYDYSKLTYATLKLVGGAKSIVKFESDNADSLNVFYEGFNDDLLYATGTRIQATLDTGVVNQWQSEGYYYEYEEGDDGVYITFGDVQAKLYRGEDGAVYADYALHYDESTLATKKLFTPVIKPVSDIPVITEGTSTINTMSEYTAYSYYRITAEKDEVWNLHFTYTGDNEEYWELGVDVYEADGTYLFNEEQEYDDETGDYLDLDIEIAIPAGTTRIIGLYDYSDESQEYTLTATKTSSEDPTSEAGTTNPESTTAPETTTEPVTTKPVETTTIPVTTAENKTTVAPTTKSAAQKKIDEFKKAGKAKVKKATKKKSAKKVKISLKKKLKGANGYHVRFYKTKKNAKKNKKAIAKITVKKNKKSFTVKKKKLANKKTLFIRVRGYIKVNGKTYTGKWSSVKKVKIKK